MTSRVNRHHRTIAAVLLTGTLALAACGDDDSDPTPATQPEQTDDSMVDEEMTDDSMVDDSMVDEEMTDDSMVDEEMTDDSMVDEEMTDDTMMTDTTAAP